MGASHLRLAYSDICTPVAVGGAPSHEVCHVAEVVHKPPAGAWQRGDRAICSCVVECIQLQPQRHTMS